MKIDFIDYQKELYSKISKDFLEFLEDFYERMIPIEDKEELANYISNLPDHIFEGYIRHKFSSLEGRKELSSLIKNVILLSLVLDAIDEKIEYFKRKAGEQKSYAD